MKKRLLILLIPMVLIFSCSKYDENQCEPVEVTVKAPDAEIDSLRGFLTGSGITATEDPRGFFYTFTTTGSGAKPNSCSVVTVDYVAKLLANGATIDSNTNVTYSVGAFIIGWQEALPLMPAGSTMTLYLPPSLAYGSVANGNVPANSNLSFGIRLIGVQ